MKKVCVMLCLLLALLANISADAQLTKSDIYQLDVLSSKQNAASDMVVSLFFNQLGQDELERLTYLERTEGLDVESQFRKVALERALADILEFQTTASRGGDSLQDVFANADVSEAVFHALGEETAVRLVYERMGKSIKSLATASANASSPALALDTDVIAQILKLSKQQQEDFEKLTEQQKKDTRTAARPDLTRLETLLQRHWRALLATLSTEQQKSAVELPGEPVQWFASDGSQPYRRITSSVNTEVMNFGVDDRTEDGRSVYEMSTEELEQNEVQVVCAHVLRMIRDPFVWEELELTDEQKNDIRKVRFFKTLGLSNRHQDRITNLLHGDAELPKAVSAVLNAEQINWFKQMEIQILCSEYESSVGLLHPQLSAHLGLTNVQVDDIRELSDKYANESRLIWKSLREKRSDVNAKHAVKVEELLDEEQRGIFARVKKVIFPTSK